MKLQLRGDKMLVREALRSNAELRLGLLLGRFGDDVGKVTLRLSKAPEGGRPSDKRCEIAIGLKPKNVRVECVDAELSVAFERAADMAVRSIARALRLQREDSLSKLGPAPRVLETARLLAADRVLATARGIKSLRTPRTEKALEMARVKASNRVLATAKALKLPSTPKAIRALEAARVLAAELVLATARALAREGEAV
jgi:ribosome-associated translation inhibitor RaiA